MALPPNLTVAFSGPYYFNQINRLVRDLGPLFDLDRSGEPSLVTVDLSRLTFMGPSAVVLLVATLHRLRERRLTAEGGMILQPEAVGARNYLHRIDFYKRLFDENEWPDHVDKGAQLGMGECQHVPSDPEDEAWTPLLRAVTSGLLGAVEELVPTDQAAHTSLDLALSELLENVGFHADTPFGGFAAVQYLKHSKEIELAIADLGVGIRESLSRSPKWAASAGDDLTAIRTALTATVTATPWRNSGYGLTFTQLLLALNEGRLLVRSGRGHVMRGAKKADWTVDEDLPGTLVTLRLRTDRPLDFQAAYDLLNKAIEKVRSSHDDGLEDREDDEAV